MDYEFMFRLRKAIEEKGITASELSCVSGVGKSDISNYLKGKYVPKQDKCYALAKALNVDPGWLMTGIQPHEESFNHDEFNSLLNKLETTGAYDIIDLYIDLSEENRIAAKKYLLYLKSQEKKEE